MRNSLFQINHAVERFIALNQEKKNEHKDRSFVISQMEKMKKNSGTQ